MSYKNQMYFQHLQLTTSFLSFARITSFMCQKLHPFNLEQHISTRESHCHASRKFWVFNFSHIQGTHVLLDVARNYLLQRASLTMSVTLHSKIPHYTPQPQPPNLHPFQHYVTCFRNTHKKILIDNS